MLEQAGTTDTMQVEHLLLAVGILLVLSIFASKASARFGVPALLLFLGIGMLAGSDGIGGIYFDDAQAAQRIGVVALAFILFGGGLDTNWNFVKRSLGRAAGLATLGVLITTSAVALFVYYFLHWTPLESLLLGAIVSSTDAAAVFSVLRSRSVHLRDDVTATLELESGSNDPMAVFLTSTLLLWMQPGAEVSLPWAAGSFVWQMLVGALTGGLLGLGGARLLNRIRLEYGGLYPVLTLALVALTFGCSEVIGGNGFLAVYVAGMVMGYLNFIQRRSLTRFHDGVAWLMQIAMFLVLGLLVFPTQLVPVALVSLALAAFLIFVARPLAVFATLAFSPMDIRSKTLIAWVGLRGAVPITLATFPLVAEVPKANIIFNIVFFIVLTSILVQGSMIPYVARWLRVTVPKGHDASPAEIALPRRHESELATIAVPDASPVSGKPLVEIEWPRESLILVVYREEEFFVPDGSTVIQTGDRLIVLTSKETSDVLRRIVGA